MAYVNPQTGRESDAPPGGWELLPPPPAPKRGMISSALMSGTHEALGQSASALEALATIGGLKGAADWAKAAAGNEMRRAQEQGREDLEAAPWYDPQAALYRAAKAVPSFGGMMAAGALVPEAAVPSWLARAGEAVPGMLGGGKEFAKRMVGATAAGLPLSVGGNVQRAEQGGEELTPETAAKAIALGVPEAAVGGLGPAKWQHAMETGYAGNLLERTAKASLQSGLVQGPQAGVQEALTQFMESDRPLADKAADIVNATLTGFTTGGILGAPTGIRALKTRSAKDISTPELAGRVDEELKQAPPAQGQEQPAAPEQPAAAVEATPEPAAPQAPLDAAAPAEPTMYQEVLRSSRGARNAKLIKDLKDADDVTVINTIRTELDARAEKGSIPKWLRDAGQALGLSDEFGSTRDLERELHAAEAVGDKAEQNRLLKLMDLHEQAAAAREATDTPEAPVSSTGLKDLSTPTPEWIDGLRTAVKEQQNALSKQVSDQGNLRQEPVDGTALGEGNARHEEPARAKIEEKGAGDAPVAQEKVAARVRLQSDEEKAARRALREKQKAEARAKVAEEARPREAEWQQAAAEKTIVPEKAPEPAVTPETVTKSARQIAADTEKTARAALREAKKAELLQRVSAEAPPAVETPAEKPVEPAPKAPEKGLSKQDQLKARQAAVKPQTIPTRIPENMAAQAKLEGQVGEKPATKAVFKPRTARVELTPEQKALVNEKVTGAKKLYLMGAGEEVNQKLSRDVADIVTAGVDASHVFDYLAKAHPQSDMRDLASALRRVGVRSRFEVAPLKGRLGSYDPATDVIGLHSGDPVTTVLHEGVHASTHAAIAKGTPAGKRLESLYKYTREQWGAKDKPYALTNTHEFIAEALTNPQVRGMLDAMPGPEPKKSVWQSIKGAIFRMLGLPERARTLLDHVIEAGYQAMDEQAAMPVDEKALAVKVLQLMHGDDYKLPLTTDDVNADAQTTSEVGDGLRTTVLGWLRDNGLGKLTLSEKARGVALGWSDLTHMNDYFGHLFKSGGLQEIVDARQDRDVIDAHVNQMHKFAIDPAQAFMDQSKKHAEALTDVAFGTRFGIDARKDWAEHTWLHGRKDAPELHKEWERLREQYDRLRQLGGRDVYDKLIAANRSDRFMELATTLFNYMKAEHPNENVPGFDVDPVDLFKHDGTLHESPEAAEQFWRTQFGALQSAAQQWHAKMSGDAATVHTPKEKEAFLKRLDPLRNLLISVSLSSKSMDQVPYFHRARFGDYFVGGHLARDENGEIPAENIAKLQAMLEAKNFGDIDLNQLDKTGVYTRVETPEAMEELHAIFAQAQDKGIFLKGDDKGYDEKGNFVGLSRGQRDETDILKGMSPAWMSRLIEQFKESDAFEAPDGADKETRAEFASLKSQVLSELRTQWLDMLPQNSLHRVTARRDNIQGASKDLLRAYAHRGQISANALSQLSTSPRINEALAAMKRDVKDLRKDQSSKTDHVLAAHQVLSEVALRETKRPWRTENTLLDTVRGWNHVYFLGASPAYAFEQLASIGLTLWPELAKKHGFKGAATAMARVTPMALRVMKAVWSGDHKIDAIITPKVLADAGIPASVADRLMRAVNNGAIDLGGFSRVMGAVARGDVDNFRSRALRWANAMAVYTETFGRVLGALAVHDLHRDDPNVDQIVKHTITQSFFDYGSWNGSRQTSKMGILGPFSPITFAFTGYQTKIIEKIYREMADAFGAPRRGETPQQRAARAAEAKKFLAGHLAAVIMVSGSLGLPGVGMFAGAGSKLANTLTGEDDWDLTASWRNLLEDNFGAGAGEALAHGLPRLAGIDLAKLGEADLIPLTRLIGDKRKWEEAFPSWLNKMTGSPMSMAQNIGLGFRDMSNGNYLDGFMKMAPTAVRNAGDAYRMTEEGYVDKSGRKLPMTPGAEAIVARALGFNSAVKADYDERAHIASGLRATAKFRADNIRANLVRAMEKGQPEDIQTWVAEAQRYTQDHPESPILTTASGMVTKRAKETAQARALGMPIGVKPNDLNMRKQIDYGNRGD